MDAPKFRIRVVNGLAVDHPAFEDNLIDAFGAVPPEWEPFIRIPDPTHNNHKYVLLHPQPAYRKVDGVWQDYWYYREKTAEELEALYGPAKEAWAKRPYANNFTAWVFNEQKFMYEPPIPRPTESAPPGMTYRWSGPDNNWKLAPIPPANTGKYYYFDFDNWVNVEITDNV